MSTEHRAATRADRIETVSADHYLPAMPSETLVTALQRFTEVLKRDS
jgi:hypothetical protein